MKMKTSLGLCLALVVFLSSDGIIRGTEAGTIAKDGDCSASTDCVDASPALVCLAKKCADKPGEGTVDKDAACTETKECKTGFECKDEKCAAKSDPKVGDACAKPEECGDKLECKAHKCAAKGGAGKKAKGAACEKTEECDDKLECKEKKCEEKADKTSGAQKSAQGLGLGMIIMMMAATVFASSSVATLGM